MGIEGIASVAGTAGAALAGLGAGFSFVSTSLEEVGMTEAAEGWAAAGSVITSIGAALMAIGPVIVFIIGLVKKIGDEGLKAQIKCWPLVIVLLALAAAITLITVGVSHAKKHSLEGRMQAAAEATEKAK